MLLQSGLVLVAFLSLVSTTEAQTRGSRVSDTLTGASHIDKYNIDTPFIFHNSDTLYVNGRLTQRGSSWEFVSGEGYFDLSGLNVDDKDTLVLIYSPVPSWVQGQGRSAKAYQFPTICSRR